MDVNIKVIEGSWDLGYSLDKHVLNSVYKGENQWGHPEFDTTRSEAGEALYQLKYNLDFKQVGILGHQMHQSLAKYYTTACLVVPMPPSKFRQRQPVTELARDIAARIGIPCYESLLIKTTNTQQMKDIDTRNEKVNTLVNAFSINDQLGEGQYDILIVDDLFDSGSSLEAATIVFRAYNKIRNIYVATVTRKR